MEKTFASFCSESIIAAQINTIIVSSNIKKGIIMKQTIQVKRLDREELSPEKFLKLSKKEQLNISYSEIIPARLGKADFGKIMVHYKTPLYK